MPPLHLGIHLQKWTIGTVVKRCCALKREETEILRNWEAEERKRMICQLEAEYSDEQQSNRTLAGQPTDLAWLGSLRSIQKRFGLAPPPPFLSAHGACPIPLNPRACVSHQMTTSRVSRPTFLVSSLSLCAWPPPPPSLSTPIDTHCALPQKGAMSCRQQLKDSLVDFSI